MNPLLEAFSGQNTRIPVWLMRQAGRYLPEYRAIRARAGFLAMMHDPATAAHITCLPVHLLHVDAAILFADILTLPMAMGFDIDFQEGVGPVVHAPLRAEKPFPQNRFQDRLGYLDETIRRVRRELPEGVPLIGFAGSPFTVLTYLVEGGSSRKFSTLLGILHKEPAVFENWMDRLTAATIDYLQFQKRSGIEVFQLFDTWAGILSREQYLRFVQPHVRNIFQSVDLPSIYYGKHTSHLLDCMAACGSDFISVCEQVDLEDPRLVRTGQGIQGNLHHLVLYEEEELIERQTRALLKKARLHSRYIFNLSHGLLPDMDPGKVRALVDYIKRQPWK